MNGISTDSTTTTGTWTRIRGSNQRRVRALRQGAAWLEANPDLPISRLSVNDDGEVRLAPARVGAGGWDERSVRGLYAIADAVGATVAAEPDTTSGWELTARWGLGEGCLDVVPITAAVWLADTAVNVRPAGGQDTTSAAGTPDAGDPDAAGARELAHAGS